MLGRFFLRAAVLTAIAGTAAAQSIDATLPTPLRTQLMWMPTPVSIAADKAYRERIAGLRVVALRQQAADGGKLTEEHRSDIQDRLNAVNRRYAEKLRRLDLLSAGADGWNANSSRQ